MNNKLRELLDRVSAQLSVHAEYDSTYRPGTKPVNIEGMLLSELRAVLALPSILNLSYDEAHKIECELPAVHLPGGHTIGGVCFPAPSNEGNMSGVIGTVTGGDCSDNTVTVQVIGDVPSKLWTMGEAVTLTHGHPVKPAIRYVRAPSRKDPKYHEEWPEIEGGPVFDGVTYCNDLFEALKRFNVIVAETMPEGAVDE